LIINGFVSSFSSIIILFNFAAEQFNFRSKKSQNNKHFIYTVHSNVNKDKQQSRSCRSCRTSRKNVFHIGVIISSMCQNCSNRNWCLYTLFYLYLHKKYHSKSQILNSSHQSIRYKNQEISMKFLTGS
jgi:hypothetical protein